MSRSAAAKKLELTRQEAEWRRCKRDPVYWLEKYVWTMDEHDKENPYKRLVQHHGELPYMPLVVEKYLSERHLIFLKSRQLRITWICSALDVHEALFHSARKIPINAYKEDDAADILDRCQFVYEGNPSEADRAPGLPKWMRDRNPMQRKKKPHEMVFMAGSMIRAVAEGEENLRGKTISRWRCEEARSQPALEGTCGGILPSLQQVGQACFVSSAGPGYFKQLVEDTSDPAYPGKPPPPEEFPTGLQGVRMWRNCRNGYLVVRIHYTADPNKRDPQWLKTVTAGMPDHQIAMEYEIDFSARGGTPALKFFVENKAQIVQDFAKLFPQGIPQWWPRFASADYGTTKPYSCHFHAVGPDGTLYTYWEYYSPGALGDHLNVITAQPDWPLIQLYILDRACWAATQQVSETVQGQTMHGVRSIADLHQTHEPIPVNPTPATVTSDTVKVEALAREWKRPEGAKDWKPKTVISDQCTYLIAELHGIKWAPQAPHLVHHQEKLIDRDNHAFDDQCYGVLHYRNSGIDSHPSVTDLTPDEIQRAFTANRQLEHIKRTEAQIEGLGGVEEVYEDYGLVH